MERRIGIVGAGVSGLLACKYVLSKGFLPIVFDCRSTIGGVWTQTLETTKLQSPKSFYRFSDFPWPESVETVFPDQQQVMDYLQSYAKHFDLLKHIKFNTKVVSIKYEGPSEGEMESWDLWGGNGDPFGNKGKWNLTFQDLTNQSIEETQVDFVILCLGRYSDLPNIPEFPSGQGPEAFEGKVIHSMDYSCLDNQSARNLVKGKRVTVVGFHKSALDIALECSVANGIEHPCTVICRTPRWNLPTDFPWEYSIAYLFMSRFAELMVHKPGESPLLSLLATLLSLLRWCICKYVEIEVKKRHPIKKFGMVPDHSFLQESSSWMFAGVPEGFYENAEKGSLILKRSPTFSFYKEGVLLADSVKDKEPIKSDLVIFATGFKGGHKLKYIFESPKFQNYIMGSSDKTNPLYRQCIHPRIPQLAAIGYLESFANVNAFELRCRWLVELLDGKFMLPSIQKMEKEVLQWEKCMEKYSGYYSNNRSCIGELHIWCNDQLCKDMGWNPMRKKGAWAELFEMYGPMDYVPG